MLTFVRNGKRTYVAWNTAAGPVKVRFSDGTRLEAKPGDLAIKP